MQVLKKTTFSNGSLTRTVGAILVNGKIIMGKTIERHDPNVKSHVPLVSRLLSKMAPKHPVHTGIHTHRHACALHMRAATTISAMNEKGCARWCHMRPTVLRAVPVKSKILSQLRRHSARASGRTRLQEACTRT